MKKIQVIHILFILLLMPIAASAEQAVKVVLLPLKAKNISKAYTLGAAQMLRDALKNTGGIELVPVQKQDDTYCADRDCLATYGKKYKTDKVIIGKITGQGEKTRLTLKSFNSKTGQFDYEASILFEPADKIDTAIHKLINKYITDVLKRIQAPTGLIATIAKEAITVSWKQNKQAKKYVVYRSKSKKGVFKKVTTTQSTQYKDIHVSRGDRYYYKVQSLDDKGFSGYSDATYGIRAYSETGFYLRGIIPGWGQLYYGHTLKGSLFLGGFALSCALSGILYQNYHNKKSDYRNYDPTPSYPGDTSYQSELDSRYDEYNQAYQLFLFSAIITGIVYVANWADILFLTSKDPRYPVEKKKSDQNSQSTFVNINSYVVMRPYTERRTEVSLGLRF